MDIDFTNFKYGRYIRKSSDEKDKQAHSIATQDRELTSVSSELSLYIVREWRETRTAFFPGRPHFAEMVDFTIRGDIDAWLIWHPTRLSRNPVDAGTVIHLMDIGKLHHVRTPNRIYFNTPTDKLLLNFELMISKKDSDDKSLFIRQNIETKSAKGIPHSIAKIGYQNSKLSEKGTNYWLVDKENFKKVKYLFDLLLTGKYSVRQLHEIARDKIELRTPVRKNSGGLPLSRSRLYVVLQDPIYAGFFYYNGKRFALDRKLPRMISEDQYWEIQSMLGRTGRPKPIRREALYNKFMKDTDGGGVTPDFKFQLICSNCKRKFSYPNKERCPSCHISIESMTDPTYLSYTYYYSTREKKSPNIRAKGIEETKIERALLQYFKANLLVSQRLCDWMIRNVRTVASEDRQGEIETRRLLAKREIEIQSQLKRLLNLRISKPNLDADYARYIDEKEEELRVALVRVKSDKTKYTNIERLYPKMGTDLAVLANLEKIFKSRSGHEKEDVLRQLGSNLTLSDGKVSVLNKKWVQAVILGLQQAKRKNRRFEPRNTLADKDPSGDFSTVCPILR